ncbi:hypothetical protein QBC35DRAFT_387725 [Podospora australis]|uniref:Uncharacterized protein n=1 Tax=Podospora australis TaxID=1536484 RepID=A0AAN6WRP6_9PEZI|nr:hypothetical protein QBC35DRAFT_387725 [Podospora australis]
MSKQSGENWTAYKYWYDEGTKFKEQITALEAGTADLQLRLQRTTEACQTLKEKQVNHERTKVELGRYRNEYAELEMRCQQAEGTYKQKLAAETHDLKVQLETVEAQHRQMMHEATTKLGQEKQTLAQEIRTLQEENARNIQKWEESRQNELHTLQEHFQGQVNEVQRGFENELARKEELHQLEIKDLKERVRSLESSLVDNSDDFRPATDDLLKNSYEQLSLAIETITHNLRVVDFPRSSNLDPDGFLQTHERTEAKFLLRSVIWQQIRNGFFCSPFGLGALGPGEGKRRLLELWIQYRRLIGGSPPPTVSIPLGEYDVPAVEKDSIDVFRSDKEANKWRSSTFQAIMSALKSANSKDHLGGGVITPYFNNRDQIHDNILSILDQVAPGSITEDIGDKVSKLIDRAGELALQFGMQRAELGLRGAIKGVQMAIGRDFIDCYDDDGQGEVKEVVLTITPMCYKAGDGRNDLHTPKVMAQGMIYSVRSL